MKSLNLSPRGQQIRRSSKVKQFSAFAVKSLTRSTVEEAVAKQPTDPVDQVLEEAVERAVADDLEEAPLDLVAPEPEPEEVLEEAATEPAVAVPAHETIMEELTPTATKDGLVEESETVSEDTTTESKVTKTAVDSSTDTADYEDAPAEINKVESVLEQPTIIVTRATMPVSDDPTPVTRSSSSDSVATTVTVIRDGQSSTTTAPIVTRHKTVTFAQDPKPRIIDRGRWCLVRDPILKVLLGRRITEAVGPDVKTMLAHSAGKFEDEMAATPT